MSTQINISYDDGGLRNANRRQATANRVTNRLRQNQSKVTAQGSAILAARRAAAGANTQGQINDYPFTPPAAKEEIGVSRFNNVQIGHQWELTTELRQTLSTGLRSFGNEVAVATVPVASDYDLLLGCGNGNVWNLSKVGSLTSLSGLPGGTIDDVPPWFDAQPISVEKTFAEISPVAIARQSIVLPAGSGNFIYTVISAYCQNMLIVTGQVRRLYPGLEDPLVIKTIGIENFISSSFSSVQGVDYSSFVVSNNAIRQVTTPDALKEILLIAAIKVATINTAINVWPLFGSNYQEVHPLKDIVSGTQTGLYMFDDSSFDTRLAIYSSLDRISTTVYSPNVFNRLNEVQQFTDAIKSVPVTHKGVLADGRVGIYKRFKEDSGPTGQTVYEPTDSFNYAQWPVANRTPSLGVWEDGYEGVKPKTLPKSRLRLSSTRVADPFGYDITSASVPYETIIAVTDWQEPAYCRAMCRALGFSNADLKP